MALVATTLEVEDDYVEETDYYLQLSERVLSFEAASKAKLTNVFFDKCNSEVFCINSGDITEVTVKSALDHSCLQFSLEGGGNVVSIRFSPDKKMLAVQREASRLELLALVGGEGTPQSSTLMFSHYFKGVLLDYYWITERNLATYLLLLTDEGPQLANVSPRELNIFKNKTLPLSWFSYSPSSKYLLVSPIGAYSFNLFKIESSDFPRVTKFEPGLDLPAVRAEDVTLCELHGQLRILIMNQQPRMEPEIFVYTLGKSKNINKTHILRLQQSGRFAVNIVDNLVVVHHQGSKSSLVFEVGDEEGGGGVLYREPVLKPYSLRSAPDLYSPNWIAFQPNIIVDAKLGKLRNLEVVLGGFLKIENLTSLTEFLLLRKEGKRFIAAALLKRLEAGGYLEQVSESFDIINQVYRADLDKKLQAKHGGLPGLGIDCDLASHRVVLDQPFMLTSLFSRLEERAGPKPLVPALVAYSRSLAEVQVPLQPFLQELLLSALVSLGQFFKLHQLLQHHALGDSQPLASLLLGLAPTYPPAHQLALDMLQRLGDQARLKEALRTPAPPIRHRNLYDN